MILNEPAGKVARAVVEYTVNLVVKVAIVPPCAIPWRANAFLSQKMWHDEDEDVNAVIDKVRKRNGVMGIQISLTQAKILQVLHHPYFATSNSEVQCRMMDHLKQWIDGLKPRELEETIQALTKVGIV